MIDINTEMIVSVIAIILGSAPLSAIIIHFLNKRKSSAETRSVEVKSELEIVNAAIELNQVFREELMAVKKEIAELKERITEIEAENKRLQDENDSLRKQVEYGLEGTSED